MKYVKFVITVILVVNLSGVKAQWYRAQDFINAKRILVELYGMEKFGFMPEVDTITLSQIRKEVQSWQKVLKTCIDTLAKPKPNFEKIKITTGMDKTHIKEIQAKNSLISENESYWYQNRSNAVSLLAYYPYNYQEFNRYGNVLLPIVRYYINNFKSEYGYKIAAFLDLPQTFSDSLKNSNNTPLMVKARLQDTIAEQVIIENFKKCALDTLTNDSLPVYTKMLFFINSEKSMNVFFDALQSHHAQRYYFKLSNDPEIFCRWYSLAYRLLIAYQNYYPYEIRYFEKFIFNHPGIPDEQETSVYFDAVSKYLSEKFNKSIKIQAYYMGAGTLIPTDQEIIPLNETYTKK